MQPPPRTPPPLNGHHPRWCRASVLAALLLTGLTAAPASGQSSNPVYVDDSARAHELLLRARDQTTDNATEAARLYQELLDVYALRLVPVRADARSVFTAVRRMVLADLLARPDVLDRLRALEDPAARRMLESGDVEGVVRTRPWTGPGLHAMITLAQRASESGRFHEALDIIEDAGRHPGSTDPRARHHLLLLEGVSAMAIGRRLQAERALAAFDPTDPDGAPFRQALQRAVARGPLPAPEDGRSIYSTAPTEALESLVPQTIWSAALAPEPLQPSNAGAPTVADLIRRSPDRRRPGDIADASGITATVTDAVAFVSEGSGVIAISRITGRPLWREPFRDPTPQSSELRGEESAGDLSVASVAHGRVVALTGQFEAGGRPGHGAIVCLDAATGRLRWRVVPSTLAAQPALEGLFPHGQPVIFEGRVFVLARQVTPERLAGTYVLALDLESGRPEWIRYLASSGTRTSIARPLSTLVVSDGRLLATTAIGATAMLRPATGEVDWLRRDPVPVDPRDVTTPQIWEVSSPILLGDRIHVLSPDHRSILTLDRATGDSLQVTTVDEGAPRIGHLLSDGRRLFAVGRAVDALDPEHPGSPLWSFPPPDRRGPEWAIVGRVQAGSAHLLVPLRSGLHILDVETGEVLHRLETETPGNPLAEGAQVLLTTGTAVSSYMSLARAEALTRDRMSADRNDPEAALDLVRLGVRAGQLPLVLEGAELVLPIVQARGDANARRRLFEQLLEMHRLRPPRDRETADAFYGLMLRTADDDVMRMEQLFAHAAWLEMHEPDAAVVRYQAILGDPRLGMIDRRQDVLIRPAGAWAVDGLRALAAAHGPGILRGLESAAQARAAAALAADDATALLGVALEFPLGEVAPQAALAAADRLIADGRIADARRTLLSAWLRNPTPERAARLLGRMADDALATDAVATAAGLVAAADAFSRGMDPGRRAAIVAGARWPRWQSPQRRPRLGAAMDPFLVLPGRLLPPGAGAVRTGQLDDVLLVGDDGIRAMAPAPDGARWIDRWTVPLSDPGVEVVAVRDRTLVLWLPGRSVDPRFADDPRLVALDRDTGRVRWQSPQIGALGERIPTPPRGAQELMPNQLPFDPGETLLAVGPDLAWLVRRNGSVAAFDLSGGEEARWTLRRALDQVHFALACDAGLILIGRERVVAPDGERDRPVLMLLHPLDGRVVHRIHPRSARGIAWVRTHPIGLLLAGSPETVDLYDIRAGEHLWSTDQPELVESRGAWIGDSGVIIEDRVGGLRTLDLISGALGSLLALLTPAEWDAGQVEEVLSEPDGTWLIRFTGRIARYDATGTPIGADVIAEPRSFVDLVRAEGRLFAVSLFDSRTIRLAEDDRIRMQRSYRIYPLHPDGRLVSEPVALPPVLRRFQSARGIDGWLLLGTDAETIAIPFPPAP